MKNLWATCIVAAAIVGCAPESDKSTMPTQDGINADFTAKIQRVFSYKKTVALDFKSRVSPFSTSDFSTSEAAEALKLEFDYLGKADNTKTIEPALEIAAEPTQERCVAVIERVTGTFDDGDKFGYADKYYFFFSVDGRIDSIRQQHLNLPIETTPYSLENTMPFAVPASRLRAKADIMLREELSNLFKTDVITEEEERAAYTRVAQYLREDITPSTPQRGQPTINKSALASYAQTYTDNTGGSSTTFYNKSYRFFVGSDCANYVSQCLRAGGFTNEGTGSTTSCSSWWYNNKGTSSTSDDSWSNTWSVAASLFSYLTSCKNYATNRTASSFLAVSSSGVADIARIQSPSHVMLCTKKVGSTCYFSAHTNNRLNTTLSLSSTSTTRFADLP